MSASLRRSSRVDVSPATRRYDSEAMIGGFSPIGVERIVRKLSSPLANVAYLPLKVGREHGLRTKQLDRSLAIGDVLVT